MELPLIVAIGIALIIFFIFFAIFYFDKKRREAIQALALRLGFTYRRGPEPFTLEIPEDAEPLLRSNLITTFMMRALPQKKNICVGKRRGISAEFFDLLTTTSHMTKRGSESRTRSEQAVILTLESELAPFTLAPENFFTRLGEHFGMEDLDFPEDTTFSERFVLKGGENLRKLFSQRVRQAILALPTRYVEIISVGEKVIFKTGTMRSKELAPFVEACLVVGEAINDAQAKRRS